MAEFNSPPTPEQRIKELEKQLEAVVYVMERDYGVRVTKSTKKRCPRENHSRFERHEVLSVSTNSLVKLITSSTRLNLVVRMMSMRSLALSVKSE